MREIKFRRYIVGANLMQYDFTDDTCYIKNGHIKNRNHKLMQFTGLKDKNGKEIYEGDIVEDDDFTYEVGFRDYKFGLIHKIHKDYLCDLSVTYINKYCEVIGNIYENPELLKK